MSKHPIDTLHPPGFRPGHAHPEADYLELSRLSAKLGLPVPQIHLTLSACDAAGARTAHYHARSHTFNRNFWNYIFGITAVAPNGTATFAAGFLAMKDTGNTVRAINFGAGGNYMADFFGQAGAANSARGIVAGIGSTAESFEHNALTTQCVNGNGVNQFGYDAQLATTVAYTAGTKTWDATIRRLLHNNSAATIVVTEIGIIAYGPATFNFLLQRDLLAVPINVLAAGQLTATYTYSLTFPA